MYYISLARNKSPSDRGNERLSFGVRDRLTVDLDVGVFIAILSFRHVMKPTFRIRDPGSRHMEKCLHWGQVFGSS